LKTAIYIREFVILIVTKYILKVVVVTSQKIDDVIEVGDNTLKNHPVPRQKTGIPKLDEVLNGGLPKCAVTLLAGMSGTGKTILSFQWLFEGVKQRENGIYISIIDPLDVAVRNIETMEFYDKEAIKQKKLMLVNIEEDLNYEKIDVQLLLIHIKRLVEETNAKRLVIDPITSILHAINDKAKEMHFMIALKKVLTALECTTILTSNVTEPKKYSAYTIEEVVSDGIILLSYITGESQLIRKLSIIKMRGINFRSGEVTFDITSSGIILYPKIPIDRSVATTEFKNRINTGVKELDSICGGGFPQGHMVMLSGNSGSGKTTLALQFLNEGLENGEGAVYVALEESASQIKKTALAHDWDLEGYEKSGNFVFINPSLIDMYPDKLLYEILDAVNKTSAKRAVIDSMSSLESAAIDKNKLREFSIQLTSFLKSKGVTCIMTYLSENTFGAESGQLLGKGPSNELRLSSIIDGIIILRYVEREQSVMKLINILKMRGSPHDKKIWQFEVEKDGIKIGHAFEKYAWM
jgi:circadian clock protein KaiC